MRSAICGARIARARVVSRRGAGAVRRALSAAAAPPMIGVLSQAGRTMDAEPRILVIEDDALQIQAHVMMLEDWGYRPVVARDAGEARGLLRCPRLHHI